MTEAIKEFLELDRRRCRRSFEERFTVERMVQDYLRVYERVLKREISLTRVKHSDGIE